ncbi:MAG: Rrf2 family transcriptional regulator [Akkermansiaceae bacterium]|nr:Rrf2 family transcriptional regulator [Akkermansiaceae bacterium]
MLKISTKGRYALRIMIDLAHHIEDGPVSLRAVAERQQVTLKYMESIMSLLLREELVVSSRGKSGGYKLTREPKDYSVYEILHAAEGNLAPVQCLATTVNDCPLQGTCPTLPMWEGLNELVMNYLGKYTLDTLVQGDNMIHACER